MTSRFVAESGSVFHVEDVGAGAPVLALHGLGGGAFFFHEFARRLAASSRVIAVDLPGTGRSTSARPFTFATWVDDLGDLVRRHIGAPVVIVGHSLATILALQAWQRWPDGIRALVFAGGLPKARQDICHRLACRATAISQSGLGGWGEQVARGVFAPGSAVAYEDLISAFARAFETQDPQTYVRCIELLVDASAAEIVPSVEVPCLAVTGSEDQYAPPRDVQAFVRELPGTPGEIVLSGSGHMPFFECPERFAGAVRMFLDRLT